MALTTTTVATIAVVAALASAGAGAYAATSQAAATKAASKYNQKVARNNAMSTAQQAKFQADRIRKRNRLLKGKQQAAFLKSGTDLSGSAQDVMLDSAIDGALDVAAIEYGGATGAQAYRSRARLAGYEGANAERGGYVAAGGAILSGIGGAARSYPDFE